MLLCLWYGAHLDYCFLYGERDGFHSIQESEVEIPGLAISNRRPIPRSEVVPTPLFAIPPDLTLSDVEKIRTQAVAQEIAGEVNMKVRI